MDALLDGLERLIALMDESGGQAPSGDPHAYLVTVGPEAEDVQDEKTA